MLENYEQKRQAVLDLANIYLKDRKEVEDNVPLEKFKAIVKNLDESKYILAVVGEVKAGKSTFINALLKEEVLPSGVLQNTKAVIEIKKSQENKKYIKVVWGDLGETKFESENREELNNHLKKIAAVDERYRDIPTTIIDDYLLNDITDIPLEALEKEGEYETLKGKEDLIKRYIEEYKDKSKIPVEIHVVYPLRYTFSDLVVVDSPGVNAIGGIQKRTKEFIYRANAIIFVRTLESGVEHTSFHKFFSEVVPDRSKETLFLVFTKVQGKIHQLKSKINGIKQYDIIKEKISEEKIIGVDSLYRLLQFELENYKSPEELINRYKNQMRELTDLSEKGNNNNEASNDELSEKLEILENKLEILEKIPHRDNKELFEGKLKEISNFDKMEEIIERFSTQAKLQQLREILESIRNGYKYQGEKLNEDVKLKETKMEDPQEFEKRIREYEDALKEYEYDKSDFIRNLRKKYEGVSAFYVQDIHKIINSLDNISQQDSENKIRRECENIEDRIRTLIATVVEEISKEISDYFKNKGTEFKEKYDITIPTVDVNTLKITAMKSSGKEEDVLELKQRITWVTYITFGIYKVKEWVKTGTSFVFNNELFLQKFKDGIKEEYEPLLENLQKQKIVPVVEKYCESFNKYIDHLIKVRRDYLDEQLQAKETNDQMIKDVEDLKKKLEDIEDRLLKVKNQEGLLR